MSRKNQTKIIIVFWVFVLPIICTANTNNQILVNPDTKVTSSTSSITKIEFEHIFEKRENKHKRFFFILPHDRQITGVIKDAKFIRKKGKGESAKIEEWSFERLNKEKNNLANRVKNNVARTFEIATLRHFRIGEIKINPLLQNSQHDKIWLTEFHVELKFNKPLKEKELNHAKTLYNLDLKTHRDFRFILSKFTSNPEAMELYGKQDFQLHNVKQVSHQPAKKLTGSAEPILHIKIDQDGLYQINHQFLLENNISPESINPKYLKIFSHSKEVPSQLVGGFGENFLAKDSLIFYAEASRSQYTRYRSYFLAVSDESEALRMQEVETQNTQEKAHQPEWYLNTVTHDDNTTLIKQTDNFLSIKDYAWVSHQLDRNTTRTIKFECPQIRNWEGGMVDCEVKLFLLGMDSKNVVVRPPAQILFNINGHKKQIQYTNNDQKIKKWKIPVSILKEKDNILEITRIDAEKVKPKNNKPNDGILFLDHFKIEHPKSFKSIEYPFQFSNKDYPEKGIKNYTLSWNKNVLPIILDITRSNQPKVVSYQLKNNKINFKVSEDKIRKYLITPIDQLPRPNNNSAIKFNPETISPGKPVEYLVISHQDFLEPAQRLVDFHQQRGLSTKLIDVESIYNFFNHGELHPEAIKAYLFHALTNWHAGGPLYVVFIGDANSDYLGDFKNDIVNFIPSYTLDRGSRLDRWASDHWYTTLLGTKNYSDIILGRISVANKQNAYTVINKTIQYLNDPAPGTWRETVTLVADDGRFDDDCEDLLHNFIPNNFRANRIYLDDKPLKDNFYLPRDRVEAERMKVSPQMTTDIMNAFNQGSLITTYHGHGSPNIWTDERVWFGGDSENSDNVLLRNRARLPLLINMTCNSGAIDYPQRPWNICITEDFMRVKNGGVIACYVPTGPGIPSSHQKISRILMNNFFQENIDHVGHVLLLSQYQYLAFRFPLDIVQMFLYLGDPNLQFPRPDLTNELLVESNYCLAGTTKTFQIDHTFEKIKKGNVVTQLFDPEENLVWDSNKKKLNRGKLDEVITIPNSAEPGTWKIRSYSWDQEGNDEVAWQNIFVGTPELKIKSFISKQKNKIYNPSDLVEAELTLENTTQLPANNQFIEVFEQHGEEPIEVITVTLAPKTQFKQNLTLKIPENIDPANGLFSFNIQITQNGKTTTKHLIVPVGQSEKNKNIRFVENLRTPKVIKRKVRHEIEWFIWMVNTGEKTKKNIQMQIKSKTGKTITKRISELEPFKGQWVHMKGQINKAGENPQLEYMVQKPDLVFGKNIRKIKYPKSIYPELEIHQENIKLKPDLPMEGQTVFIELPVSNNGDSIAEKINIDFYDKNPTEKGAQKIKRAFTDGEPPSYTLKPGESKTLNIRLDPWKNAGKNSYWIKIDSSDYFIETNEENNIAQIKFKARSKYNLKPGSISIEKTEEKRKIKLNITIINDGESDAYNVLASIFRSTEQTNENKMGEVLIPQIPPQTQITVPYFHYITDEDIKSMRANNNQLIVTYQIGLKGSLQRISSTDTGPNT